MPTNPKHNSGFSLGFGPGTGGNESFQIQATSIFNLWDGSRRGVVLVSRPCGFGPNEAWTSKPYYRTRGTFLADVTGDGRANAIVINDDKVVTRRASS